MTNAERFCCDCKQPLFTNNIAPSHENQCADCAAAEIKPRKDHIGPGCGRGIVVYVQRGFTDRAIVTRCGSTGPQGYPQFCDACEGQYADRDWRREAIEAGENFDEEY